MGEAIVCEPDVRWDGVSHEQIVTWTRHGLGGAVTERLEARLADVTEALDDNSDAVNAVLQRTSGGEWTGGAAQVAAAAMQVVRDFDDLLGHHGRMNVLAAFGQSDNATWARANVPPFVDVRAAQVPTGTPLDAVNATDDVQHRQQAAKDAEERARQVMREYQTMTTDRIAALPPLSPAPQVVVTSSDGITVPSGAPDGEQESPRVAGSDARPRPDERPPPSPPPGGAVVPVPPARKTGSPTPVPGATPSANGGAPTRTAAAGAAPFRPVTDIVRGPLPDSELRGGQPGSEQPGNGYPGNGRPGNGQPGKPQPGRGGAVGVHPGDRALRVGGRGGITEVLGQAARGGPFGAVPGGQGKTDEDKERRGRYAVPGSEIFEPDNDDGLLHDPFRPGSYVAPASIGDDDE